MKTINYLIVMMTACNTQAKEVADAIYINGKIYTVDQSMEWADAFAVKDGKFIAVGTTKDTEALKGKKTKIVLLM